MFLDYNDQICGCAASNKKSTTAHILRINLWIKNSSDSKIVLGIGKRFRELLGLEKDDVIKFFVHREINKNGIYKTKPRYEL